MEPPQVMAIVGTDQAEGHRQITERIGGQQPCEPARVQLIDAERAAGLFQDPAAMLSQFERREAVAEPVVDEACGQVQEESTPKRLDGPFEMRRLMEPSP